MNERRKDDQRLSSNPAHNGRGGRVSGIRSTPPKSCALCSSPAHNGRAGRVSGTRLDAAASCAPMPSGLAVTRRNRRSEKGVSLMIGIVSLVFVIPMVGLSVDTGFLYATRSKL